MQSVMIFGRQPALGLTELESLYGATSVHPAGTMAAVLDADPDRLDFGRLGGSVKSARLLTSLNTTDWKEIEKYLVKATPSYAADVPEGKLTIGISVYGIKVSPATINATGLTLKKAVRASGRSVRLVPNKEAELNTAQVLYNKLTGENGWELLLIRDGDKTLLAQTVAVQDITSYTIRDRERPKRDTRVGMLPPKLAQIIINLAVDGQEPSKDFVILDPFCGTGVVLQEAYLMGYSVVGTDIEQRMIDYTSENISWLIEQYPNRPYKGNWGWQLGDATTHNWQDTKFIKQGNEVVNTEWQPLRIGAIASETYLGRPFTTLPSPEILAQTVSECNLIIKKFLRNIGSQIQPGTRMCLALPAWQIRPGKFKHLPLIDQISDMGYNRIRFELVRDEDLLYYREGQVVARELLVLVKK